ncbi:MAG: DUF823 domain-containing adhesin, partial [Chania sp.]
IFTVTSGAATPASQTVQTSASGVATAALVSLVAAGNQVTARVGSFTTVAQTSTFVVAPLTVSIAGGGVRTNIGQGITLTVTTRYRSNNAIAPNKRITFSRMSVLDRQGATRTSGNILLNGTVFSSFSGTTNATGQMTVTVTDPSGVGVRTTLSANADSGDTATTTVTFNVRTSPDSPSANMYGFMSDTVVSPQGITFQRSPLAAESSFNTFTQTSANEAWGGFTNAAATSYCQSIGGTIPTAAELQNLANNNIVTLHGWPATVRAYWSSNNNSVNLQFGNTTPGGDGDFIACRR